MYERGISNGANEPPLQATAPRDFQSKSRLYCSTHVVISETLFAPARVRVNKKGDTLCV